MSRCASRRCSRSCHGEYGNPCGFLPRASGGRPLTARSKSTCASCHATAAASCWRMINTEVTELTEGLFGFLDFSVFSVVSVLIVLVPLEELDRALMLFRGRARRERAKVLAL